LDFDPPKPKGFGGFFVPMTAVAEDPSDIMAGNLSIAAESGIECVWMRARPGTAGV
jgi:hypothetical protein